jgi:hypothetical protein
METPGISLSCPTEASTSGPIPIEVIMRADARTYWDNDGILDKALTVALVRRDGPGLRFLEKIDANAIMMPDEPLPGRPSDAQLDADTGMVTETKGIDAAVQPGIQQCSADYFVTAGFSKWWAGLRTLRVTDPRGRSRPSDRSPLGLDMRPALIRRPSSHPDQSVYIERESHSLVVPFRVAAPVFRSSDSPQEPHVWLSVIGFKLDTRGGACGGVFGLDVEDKSAGVDGEATIPLSALAPRPDAGCWMFLGFMGGEALSANEVLITNDDVG